MPSDRYLGAIEELAQLLNLTPEALNIAEGWSILPETMQRHVKILIDDYITTEIPQLADLYANASGKAQLRFNRIVERIQDEKRGIPPADDATV